MKRVILPRSRLLLSFKELDLNPSLLHVLLKWHVLSIPCLSIWKMPPAIVSWKTFQRDFLRPSKESSSSQRGYLAFHSSLWMIRSLCSRLVSIEKCTAEWEDIYVSLSVSRLSCVSPTLSLRVDNILIDSKGDSSSLVSLSLLDIFMNVAFEWYQLVSFSLLYSLVCLSSFSWSLWLI